MGFIALLLLSVGLVIGYNPKFIYKQGDKHVTAQVILTVAATISTCFVDGAVSRAEVRMVRRGAVLGACSSSVPQV